MVIRTFQKLTAASDSVLYKSHSKYERKKNGQDFSFMNILYLRTYDEYSDWIIKKIFRPQYESMNGRIIYRPEH